MHPLLRFTLDLFESGQAPAPAVATTSEPEPATSANTFRHPRANREAQLCGSVVAYEFKRGKRRTIGFSVGPDGLVVRAPQWVALREVDSALQEKSGWIIKKAG